METYYTLLETSAQASAEEITAAYERQRERWNPARVAALGDELRQAAEQRTVEINRAYAVLSDAAQRREYDASVSGAAGSAPRPARRAGLSRRELGMAAGGALIGLLAIAFVWVLSSRAAAPTLPPAAQTNRPAPDFALPTLDGDTVRLSDYRGKVVLLNFWYTGCEPCREETPALQAAYGQLGAQGLQIIGVNVRANEAAGEAGNAAIRKFTGDNRVTYPIVIDADSKTNRDYQVYVLPTSVMIDGRGQIRYLMFSAVTTSDVEALFHNLQQENSAWR